MAPETETLRAGPVAPRARALTRTGTERSTQLLVAAIAGLTAIAFLLRISQVHQSLVGDEVFSYQDIVGHSFTSVLSTVHTGGENSPPLFFLLAWAAIHFGDASVWIRAPSLILGTATVPVVYLLGRELVNRTAGLIAAGIMAVTPFAVYYGIEARPYASMVFFVAVSTLAMLRALRTKAVRWWVLYTLSAAAAAYSHYTSVFVLGIQALWGLWMSRDALRTPLIANVAIGLLYIPWLPRLRGKELAVIGGLYPLGVKRVLTDLVRPFPGHPGAPLRAIPTIGGLIAIAACVLAGLIAVELRRRRASPPAPGVRARLVLLVALMCATPVGLLLYSLLETDLWLPRGLSASLPATTIVVGAALAALPRPGTIAACVVIAVTLCAGTLRSFDAAWARGPFRSIASYLDRAAGPRDPITIVSLVGAPAVAAQIHRPHAVVPGTAWRPGPGVDAGYLVLDDAIARVLGITSPPRTPGFTFVGRRHYSGAFPTTVLVYRPSTG